MEIQISRKNKDIVISTLLDYPKTKDNDNLLVAYIWKDELQALGHNVNDMPVNMFLNMLSRGELTSHESIRRVRAKLQSDDTPNHNLYRGSNYHKRANKQEEIQTDLFGFNDL